MSDARRIVKMPAADFWRMIRRTGTIGALALANVALGVWLMLSGASSASFPVQAVGALIFALNADTVIRCGRVLWTAYCLNR